MAQVITVEVADIDINFNVSDDDFNKYINDQMPNEKVNSAYNFLSRTVDEKSKDEFKKIALNGVVPKGLVVMQIVGVIAEEFGSGVAINLKKPKKSPKE